MSTQARLDAYLETERAILKAQEMRGNDRWFRMADLAEVRRAIKELQLQLSRESAGGGVRFSLANLNRNP